MKKNKVLAMAALLGAALTTNPGPVFAEESNHAPEIGEEVPLKDLVIKFLALPEYEPNRYTKKDGGKFGPEEMEKGLLIGAEMKLGAGNPDGMMAPLKHSFAEITADLTFDVDTGDINIDYNDLELSMHEGSRKALLIKNKETKELTIPEGLEPYFLQIDGETNEDGSPYYVCYLPVKFTAEAMGADVTWDASMHRMVMAFAFYYSDAAVTPAINKDSPYTTKKMESDNVSWDTIQRIAADADDSKIRQLMTAAMNVVDPVYQNEDGGWGKTNEEYDLLNPNFSRLYGHVYSTFDNGATQGQIKFLGRLLRAKDEYPESFASYTKEIDTIKNGFWQALKYMEDAQNDIGGWPQYYPYGIGYFKLTTYNDNAMTHLMEISYALTHEKGLIDSSLCDDFAWVRKELTDNEPDAHDISIDGLNKMWENALDCTLDLQVEIEGQKTAWAQQYNSETGEPATGRAFELPSLCTSESQSVMDLLTNIQNPSEEVQNAVKAYADWTTQIGVTGYSLEKVSDRTRELGVDRRYLYTGSSDKSYGRFYGLDKDGSHYDSIDGVDDFYPIFSGRDGIAKLDHNVGGHERRNGYSFIQTNIEKKAQERLKKWENALESDENQDKSGGEN